MSMYNSMNGINQICVFFALPMLNLHPDEYPRFRDCFFKDASRPDLKNTILVYTRVGGDNREAYKEQIEKLANHPQYILNYDDKVDNTYAMFAFGVPKMWQEDYKLVANNKFYMISDEYREHIKKIYPELSNQIDSLIFGWKEAKRLEEENNV